MTLFDAVIETDNNRVISRINWKNEKMEGMYGSSWSINLNEPIASLFGFCPTEENGTFTWMKYMFGYEMMELHGDCIIFFVKHLDDKITLYEEALNRADSGVQIYNGDAEVVFFNKRSQIISGINSMRDVVGKHLSDLYSLDENYSTILTVIKNRAAVVNRFDSFYAMSGKKLITVNTGYPVVRGDDLLGVVLFEQNIDTVHKGLKRFEDLKEIIDQKTQVNFEPTYENKVTFSSIVGSNPRMLEAIELAKKIAPKECNVLISGETGTGKEIFAKSIHNASSRKNKGFIAINCAAIPETLIEGILFGTTKGAFTGSMDKPGLIEEANGGTLFLDELNSMSFSMQSKILRAIQEGVFRRVGGDSDIVSNVRIISACNENVFEIVRNNTLRKDLFYRLSTVTIEIPPLRERKDDIERLANHFISIESAGFTKTVEPISPQVLKCFNNYDWPGNVRELFHILEYAINVMEDGVIEIRHLPKYFSSNVDASGNKNNVLHDPNKYDFYLFSEDLQFIIDSYEEKIVRLFLEHFGYNISKTADALGIKRQSLQYRIKKYNIVV